MKPRDLAQRTYEFSVAVVNLCKALPDGPEARRIRGQLADAATAVAANYRGACRARSRAEFISKIAVCAEEAEAFCLRPSAMNPPSAIPLLPCK